MTERRGIVIHPNELSETWLKDAQSLQLNVLGLHPPGGRDAARNLQKMLEDLRAPQIRRLLDRAQSMGLILEYEMHAVSYLLPRSLFASHPDFFRMDDKGVRTPDFNLCASSQQALEMLSENAARLAALLPTASHRYYFWLDDVTQSSCHCPRCRDLSPSDQQLLCVHAMLRGVRSVDPNASIAYIAYLDTLRVPEHIQPEPGVFLEYAPIKRRPDVALNDPRCEENRLECAPLPRAAAMLRPAGRAGSRVLAGQFPALGLEGSTQALQASKRRASFGRRLLSLARFSVDHLVCLLLGRGLRHPARETRSSCLRGSAGTPLTHECRGPHLEAAALFLGFSFYLPVLCKILAWERLVHLVVKPGA